MKYFAFIYVILLSTFALSETFSAKVVDVHDGDTVTILVGGGSKDSIQKEKIRMLGLDTPEVDFSGVSQGTPAFTARDRLRELLPVGSEIQVDVGPDGSDRHNRLLGRILLNGTDVNKLMLSEGMGVMYFINPRDKKVLAEYVAAAELAEGSKLGVYGQIERGEIEVPYNFRLSVNKTKGRNLVGDFRLKKLYSSEMAGFVPLSRRVFFSDTELATSLGYK